MREFRTTMDVIASGRRLSNVVSGAECCHFARHEERRQLSRFIKSTFVDPVSGVQ